MSDPVAWERQQADEVFVEVVRQFRRRPKWRHILAVVFGAVLVILGSAVLAAHLTHRAPASTPAIGVGAGLYGAGALVFAWGAAGGFTARLAKWLPAAIILGMLAVLVLALASMTTNDGGTLNNGRPESGSRYKPPAPLPPKSPLASSPAARASGRVLAADLLTEAEVSWFVGPAPAALHTPGSSIARSRSLAIWRAALPGRTAATQPTLSLTVHHSARTAKKFRGGFCPGSAQPLPDLGWGGYVRRLGPSSNLTTRVRAGRGEWVVALQLRAGATDNPTPQLAAVVAHALDQLDWACAQ